MNLKEELNQVSNLFISGLELEADVESVDVGNWGWENYVYKSPIFRHAHVEKFFTDNLDVLHVTVFPRKFIKVPIFGFDVVAGGKDRRILSAFMDMTPTTPATTYMIEDKVLANFEHHRELPEWANMFSDTFLAVRPNEDEYEILFEEAFYHFYLTLNLLEYDKFRTTDELEILDIIGSQNYYCEQQWKNERTMGALKAKLGKEKATEFMTKVLFPKIETDIVSDT